MGYVGIGDKMEDRTHIVEGFKVKDKAELKGVAKGLRYAAEFVNNDKESRESLDKLAKIIEREAEWLF